MDYDAVMRQLKELRQQYAAGMLTENDWDYAVTQILVKYSMNVINEYEKTRG